MSNNINSKEILTMLKEALKGDNPNIEIARLLLSEYHNAVEQEDLRQKQETEMQKKREFLAHWQEFLNLIEIPKADKSVSYGGGKSFSFKYASLKADEEALKKASKKDKNITWQMHTWYDTDCACAYLQVFDINGYSVRFETTKIPLNSAEQKNPQNAGKLMTYAQRYCYESVFDLSCDKDSPDVDNTNYAPNYPQYNNYAQNNYYSAPTDRDVPPANNNSVVTKNEQSFNDMLDRFATEINCDPQHLRMRLIDIGLGTKYRNIHPTDNQFRRLKALLMFMVNIDKVAKQKNISYDDELTQLTTQFGMDQHNLDFDSFKQLSTFCQQQI